MSRYAVDLEVDQLLYLATTIHCVSMYDMDTHETRLYDDEHGLMEAFELMMEADLLVLHNGIGFDVPVIEMLYPHVKIDRSKVYDTLQVSRVMWSDRFTHPAGGSSLENWGNFFGEKKLHTDIEDWSVYTPEMGERCNGDAKLTNRLYCYLRNHKDYPGEECIHLEFRVADIISKQTQNGCGFDQDAAMYLLEDLKADYAGLTKQLVEAFDPIEQELKVAAHWEHPESGLLFSTKKEALANGIRAKDLIKGPNRIKKKYFNPSSRKQFVEFVRRKYGYRWTVFNVTGSPRVDEKSLSKCPLEEARLMEGYLLLEKRIGQVEQWLKYNRDGIIHGELNTNGAVSGRMTHSKPNMAQIPRVSSPYGQEMRAMFRPTQEGWVVVGCDASGLELRMLAHYMARWDDGEYVKIVCDGDVHTANQLAAGLPTRDSAKTFIYGFLYGAGDGKVGSIIGGTKADGKRIKEKFFASLPALKKLKDALDFRVEYTGWLRGLDGRHLPVRSPHMALNTLLQSAGAVVMKKALVIADAKFAELGVRAAFMLNVHDEFQVESHPDDANTVGAVMVSAIRQAGVQLGLRCPLDGEFKIGYNWAETH